jgi:predicted naringenin-chalcone synthase
MKYSMTISPAIAPKVRHKIEDTLKEMGYDVTDGGTMVDMSECDISFEDPEQKERS